MPNSLFYFFGDLIYFAVFVGAFATPVFEAVIQMARDDVKVRVKDELSGGGVVVHADVYTVRRDGFFYSNGQFFNYWRELFNVSSEVSYRFAKCRLGTRSVCPGFMGLMSKKAKECSSS